MKLLRAGMRAAQLVLLSGLVPAWASAQAQAPAQKLKEIEQRLEQEQQDWYDVYKAAKTEEEREALAKEYPGPEFIAEFKTLAQEAKGTDVAAAAWLRIHALAGRAHDAATVQEALERLLSDHLQSLELVELCSTLGWAEPDDTAAVQALRKIMAGSPHRLVQAGATNGLAMLLAKDETPNSKKREEARVLFGKLRDSYGDLPARDGTYKEAAEASLFELDHLQVGMTAPDFEAVDQDGEGFRLADYRGKVVLVDFWGFW